MHSLELYSSIFVYKIIPPSSWLLPPNTTLYFAFISFLTELYLPFLFSLTSESKSYTSVLRKLDFDDNAVADSIFSVLLYSENYLKL